MKIAITGGIGSGKSYVCGILTMHGIHIYDCDDGAKRVMHESVPLISALKALIGDDAYTADGYPCQRVIAQFLLRSESNRQAINDIVHPAVARDFELSGMDWLESAILFDAGFNKRTHFDFVVCVTAPLEVRISRIMQRDGITREKALEWINRQIPQEEVARRSDYEIINDGNADVKKQINELLNKITK